MAYYIDPSLADKKLADLENDAVTTTIRLVHTYLAGDTLATVTTNTVATATLAAGDITGPTGTDDRVLTFNSRGIGNATADASDPDLHVTLDNTVIVLAAVNCANQSITQNNPVTIGGFTITDNQPVLAP